MDIFQKHQNTLSIFNVMFEHRIVASYTGPFDHKVLTLLAENLESSLWQNTSMGRKFFKIFIEIAQNIAHYSHEKEKVGENIYGVGTFILIEAQDFFKFFAGNMVDRETKEKLELRCQIINSLDRDGLRELKRKLRRLPHSQAGGNIGLVQTALVSKHQLEYSFYPISDNDFFYILGVVIDK